MLTTDSIIEKLRARANISSSRAPSSADVTGETWAQEDVETQEWLLRPVMCHGKAIFIDIMVTG